MASRCSFRKPNRLFKKDRLMMRSLIALFSVGLVAAALASCGCQGSDRELPSGEPVSLETQIEQSVQALADSGQLDSSVEWLHEAVAEYKAENPEKGAALEEALAELESASGPAAVKEKAEAMLEVLQ